MGAAARGAVIRSPLSHLTLTSGHLRLSPRAEVGADVLSSGQEDQAMGDTLTLTEGQRTRLWESWLAAEMRALYFAELSYRYRRRQQFTTWGVLCLSSGATLALIGRLPDVWAWLPPGLTLLTAALSLYLTVGQHQKQAIDAADLHAGWAAAGADYERLWETGMYAEDAAATLNAIGDRTAALSRAGTGFPANRRRLLKWQDHVERQHHIGAHA